eukprot:TRINITY_DN14281_c0_g1_i1.p1 TRINITY_DN14281_c0_g1~~TRINITY_DN14281_c0_g1_i1.p1  ORF type:complete len:109 (-),score=4.80 TRINITY_DN14281_c0_g1_i1:144-470(-)
MSIQMEKCTREIRENMHAASAPRLPGSNVKSATPTKSNRQLVVQLVPSMRKQGSLANSDRNNPKFPVLNKRNSSKSLLVTGQTESKKDRRVLFKKMSCCQHVIDHLMN